MGFLKWLFAPRRDHKGMSTPSYAALVAYWVIDYNWLLGILCTDGNLFMWFALTMIVVTPILSLGWYLISLISERFQAEFIIPKAEIAYNARLERKRLQSLSKE